MIGVDTDVVVSAGAPSNYFAHCVAALVRPVGVAILRHYPLVCPHSPRVVIVMMSDVLGIYRCIVRNRATRDLSPIIRVSDRR